MSASVTFKDGCFEFMGHFTSEMPVASPDGKHVVLYNSYNSASPDDKLKMLSFKVPDAHKLLMESADAFDHAPVVPSGGTPSMLDRVGNGSHVVGNTADIGIENIRKKFNVMSVGNCGYLTGKNNRQSNVVLSWQDYTSQMTALDIETGTKTPLVTIRDLDKCATIANSNTVYSVAGSNKLFMHAPNGANCGSVQMGGTDVHIVSLQDGPRLLSVYRCGVTLFAQIFNGMSATSKPITLPGCLAGKPVVDVAVTPGTRGNLVCVAQQGTPKITVFDLCNPTRWVQLELLAKLSGDGKKVEVKTVELVRGAGANRSRWFVKALLDDGCSPAWLLPEELPVGSEKAAAIMPLDDETDDGIRAMAVVQDDTVADGQLPMVREVFKGHVTTVTWVPPTIPRFEDDADEKAGAKASA
jgi:hypothetical protein